MGDALKQVVSRAISDAAFRRQLRTNPTATLEEFGLSPAEMTALTSGDPNKLTALGIDQRASRLLAVDLGAGGASRVAGSDYASGLGRFSPDAGDTGALGRFSPDAGDAQTTSSETDWSASGGLGRFSPDAQDTGALGRFSPDAADQASDTSTEGEWSGASGLGQFSPDAHEDVTDTNVDPGTDVPPGHETPF